MFSYFLKQLSHNFLLSFVNQSLYLYLKGTLSPILATQRLDCLSLCSHHLPLCWFYSQDELKIKFIARLSLTSNSEINPASIQQKRILVLTSPALKLEFWINDILTNVLEWYCCFDWRTVWITGLMVTSHAKCYNVSVENMSSTVINSLGLIYNKEHISFISRDAYRILDKDLLASLPCVLEFSTGCDMDSGERYNAWGFHRAGIHAFSGSLFIVLCLWSHFIPVFAVRVSTIFYKQHFFSNLARLLITRFNTIQTADRINECLLFAVIIKVRIILVTVQSTTNISSHEEDRMKAEINLPICRYVVNASI